MIIFNLSRWWRRHQTSSISIIICYIVQIWLAGNWEEGERVLVVWGRKRRWPIEMRSRSLPRFQSKGSSYETRRKRTSSSNVRNSTNRSRTSWMERRRGYTMPSLTRTVRRNSSRMSSFCDPNSPALTMSSLNTSQTIAISVCRTRLSRSRTCHNIRANRRSLDRLLVRGRKWWIIWVLTLNGERCRLDPGHR